MHTSYIPLLLHTVDHGAAYPTYRTSNYNGFRVATTTTVEDVRHFHCVNETADFRSLQSHALSVPIWRLADGGGGGGAFDWRMRHRGLFLAPPAQAAAKAYGSEKLPYQPRHPFPSQQMSDIAFVLTDNQPFDGRVWVDENNNDSNVYDNLMGRMYTVFSMMEHDMDELFDSLSSIVGNLCERNEIMTTSEGFNNDFSEDL